MKGPHSMRRLASSMFCLLIANIVSTTMFAEDSNSQLISEEPSRAWHFRIGPVMAPRVRVNVTTSRPVMPALPRPGTTLSKVTDGSIAADPSAGLTDREYVDGYVKPDEGSSDPNSIVSGLTWDWGADNVSAQYSNGRMEFRTEMARWSESVSTYSTAGGSFSEGDRDILLGVEVMGGWTFFNNENFDASIDGGFRFYGSDELDARSMYNASVTTTRSEYRYVDSYDASGWTDIPNGAFNGSAEGPNRVIGATPERSEELMGTSSSTENYWYNTSSKLDYRIWDLRLGPTFGFKAMDRLTLRGGVYGLLGLVDANFKTAINTSSGSYSDKKSKCEAVFGMAAGISAQFDITDSIYLVGAAEYDWWTDEVSLRAGGSRANIELSDFTVTLAVGIEF